ncbi:MAG: TSUP family transporter, partial [Thermomicrobiales bacterium]
VGALLPWATLGTLVGVYGISHASAALIGLIASSVVVLVTVAMFTGWVMPGAHSGAAVAAAGALSGLLNSLTGMAGPPVAMLFEARKFGVQAFRTSIVGYFMFADLLAVALLLQQHVIGQEQFRAVLPLIPSSILGTMAGRRLAGKVSQERFRQVTMTLLLVTGVAGILKALADLL